MRYVMLLPKELAWWIPITPQHVDLCKTSLFAAPSLRMSWAAGLLCSGLHPLSDVGKCVKLAHHVRARRHCYSCEPLNDPWAIPLLYGKLFLLPDAVCFDLCQGRFGHAPCALPEPVSSQPWISAPSGNDGSLDPSTYDDTKSLVFQDPPVIPNVRMVFLRPLKGRYLRRCGFFRSFDIDPHVGYDWKTREYKEVRGCFQKLVVPQIIH